MGSSLVFLGLVLAGGTFGGAAVLRRLGEAGPSYALMGATSSAISALGVLAVLPSAQIPAGAMLPMLVISAALGVGWTTDTASMRLPHTTANIMLAVVAWSCMQSWQQAAGASMPPTGVMIALALAPVVAGIAFRPPSTLTVWIWHLGGRAALLAFTLAPVAAASGADGHWPGDGPLAGLGVTIAVLALGRLLVWTGQVGAGDPVWVAACTLVASTYASLAAGTPLRGIEALATATLGASMFLSIGGTAALMLAAAQSALGRGPVPGQAALAGQWTTLGLIGFAAAWKLTPVGQAISAGWITT